MRGILSLGGGDEFGPRCRKGDAALLDTLGKQAHVAIIPTAQADGGSDPIRAGNNGVRYFEALGASAENVLITDRASADDPALVKRIQAADLIYLIGGNPGYLLDTMRDTAAMRTIEAAWREGTALAGSSAGAMILCEAIMGRPMRAGTLWVAGLGLVPRLLVAVHHERSSDARGVELLDALPAGFAVLGVDACAIAAWLPDDRWIMFGEGAARLYQHGARQGRSFGHGQTWRLPTAGDADGRT